MLGQGVSGTHIQNLPQEKEPELWLLAQAPSTWEGPAQFCQGKNKIWVCTAPAETQELPAATAAGAGASGNSHTFSRGISLQQLLHCHQEEGENNS